MTTNDTQQALDGHQLAPNLPDLLRARRESLGWTIGRLANRTVGAAHREDLERIEAGDTSGLDRGTLGAIARAYDLDIALLFAPHDPLEFDGGVLRVGEVCVVPYSDHIDDVLVAYLELMRALRGDIEAPVVSFRRVDVDALADAQGYVGEAIVGRLAILIGARGLRQAALAGGYSSGVEVITMGNAEEVVPPSDNGPWDDHATSGPLIDDD